MYMVTVCTLCTHMCAHIDRFGPSSEAGSLNPIFPLFFSNLCRLEPAPPSANSGRLGTPEFSCFLRYVFLGTFDRKDPFSQIGKKRPPFVQLFWPENETGKWRLK